MNNQHTPSRRRYVHFHPSPPMHHDLYTANKSPKKTARRLYPQTTIVVILCCNNTQLFLLSIEFSSLPSHLISLNWYYAVSVRRTGFRGVFTLFACSCFVPFYTPRIALLTFASWAFTSAIVFSYKYLGLRGVGF